MATRMTDSAALEQAFALHRAGELDRARDAYRQCLALDPRQANAWWGLGCLSLTRGEQATAASCFTHVVSLAPQWGEAHHNLGKALFDLGAIDLALDALARASTLVANPDQPLGTIATIVPGSPRADGHAIAAARRAWAALAAPASPPRQQPPRRDGSGRLRIGYLSSFFRQRNWMKPVWPLINGHDRTRFAVHLFSDAPRSAITYGYREHDDDRFHDISGLSNDEAARLMAGEALDLLIDLNAYSQLSRLPLLALRPAPTVVAWFNLFAPSGVPGVDYVIGDRHVATAADRAWYRERIIRVRGCYLTFEVTYPTPDVAPPPCLTRGALTFGSLSPQYKITPQVVDAWSTVLRACPDARLFIKNLVLGSAENRRFVQELFAAQGIGPGRLELEGPDEHFAFLDRYRTVDIALDPFPYNGGTTTMEALWQGVPVLTFAGDRWASRISASLLRNAGLAELVAPTLDDHVAMAIDVGRDPGTPARLAALRRTMRDRLRRSSVCDVRAFTRGMERIYERIARHAARA